MIDWAPRRCTPPLAACLVLGLVSTGCGFRTLRKDLEISRQHASLEGHAAIRGTDGGPIVVAVQNATTGEIDDRFLLPRPAPFLFLLPAGTYRWNGHAAAAAGVEQAPVAAPSWEDMAPGSAFLTALPRTALLPECEYSLLFSYGGGSLIGRQASDGSVALSSQLWLPIQRQATNVMGFDESHTGILRSPEVAEELNAILARASGPRARASAGTPWQP
jgi:hypothetical protein